MKLYKYGADPKLKVSLKGISGSVNTPDCYNREFRYSLLITWGHVLLHPVSTLKMFKKYYDVMTGKYPLT